MRRPQLDRVGETLLRDGLNVTSPYFRTGAEQFEPGGGDYAVPDALTETQSYEWTHTLGDIVSALGSVKRH